MTVMTRALQRMRVNYPTRVFGKDQPTKVKGVVNQNPDLNCKNCTFPLTLGPSTAFGHLIGGGAEIRGAGNNRKEQRLIAAGTHEAPETIAYLCSNCNNEQEVWGTFDDLYNAPNSIEMRRLAKFLRDAGQME